MNFDDILIEKLRAGARNGLKASQLIELIKMNFDSDEYNSFSVMSYFMKAYGLSLTQVREIPGAICLGGGVYTDDDIDSMFSDSIKMSLNI